MNTILKAENLTKNYSGHCALDNVSISIPEKSVFGLLGPNGAGKTSLIRIITQITFPDSGSVFYKGEKLNVSIAGRIGYLPEERGLYKKMEVAEQLIYLARLKGLTNNEAIKRTSDWLQRLELSEWAKKPIESLSKGMQQKVQFIAAVIHQPELVILDEPFTGFDPVNAHIIKDEIINLKKSGVTIVLSTHRMESVEELCDSIALIDKSKVVLEGDVVEIKNRFKQQVYSICGIGVIHTGQNISIMKHDEIKGLAKYKIKTSLSANELLTQIMTSFQIHSFEEETPSIESIFLSLVQSKR